MRFGQHRPACTTKGDKVLANWLSFDEPPSRCDSSVIPSSPKGGKVRAKREMIVFACSVDYAADCNLTGNRLGTKRTHHQA